MDITKNNTAIVLLAYADYEALEIALASYSKYIKENEKLFILQNGRGSYDCERTYRVARRYENLCPNNIKVVDWIKPQKPYFAIKELLNSDIMKPYDYICKVDDDVFPLKDNWFDKLLVCWQKSKEKFGNDLAYVTSLVNNNPWGFKETLEIFNLQNEYFHKIAREHRIDIAGFDCKERIAPANEIYTGCCGTVWGNPYISRWLHLNTTCLPEKFKELTNDLGYKEVDNKFRYSINCMLFEKSYWNLINNKNSDDEANSALYCRENNKKIIADLSNPFVHLCFFSQREENKDLLPIIRQVYENYLELPYPIAIVQNKEHELENRCRYLENKLQHIEELAVLNSSRGFKLQKVFSIKNEYSYNKKYKVITILGYKFPRFKVCKDISGNT